jgi:ADP-ribose pyrophosphatase YjhB (NUDIX family)
MTIDDLRSRLVEAHRVAAAGRIRVAANAVIVQDQRALLVQFSGGTDAENYNFPGGGVDVGETLEEGLRREVIEETCLEVIIDRLLLIVESVGSRNTNFVAGQHIAWNELRFFFLCTPARGMARLPDNPDDDQTAVRWVPLTDLKSIELLPRVSKALLQAMADPAQGATLIPNPGFN